MTDAMFTLREVRARYGRRVVLDLPALEIPRGAVTVILGQNGSGKSTLMSFLARQRAPENGEIRIEGVALSGLGQANLARRIAFLPQLLPDAPGLDVRGLCRLGRYPWHGAFGRWRAADDAIVAESLAATGVDRFADALVDDLSGGERQRAWIAMALAQQAPCLLLDEPISALDTVHQVALLRLLSRLNDEDGRTIVTVLHDINLAARFADRIIALRDGRLAYDGAPEGLMTEARLREIYGHPFRLIGHPDDGRPVALSV